MRNEKGSIRSRILVFLPALFLLGYVGVTLAQIAADPCAIYPKQSVNIPAGTPTAKLIAGQLNKQIYICSVTVSQISGATPGLTLSYGEAVAGTPCATATPGANLSTYGANATTAQFGTGNTTILGPIPAAASTPVVDVCGLIVGGNTINGGSMTYVQVKP